MEVYDAQTLAETLKWYLQELPVPLVPPTLCTDLLCMAQGKQRQASPMFCGVEEF